MKIKNTKRKAVSKGLWRTLNNCPDIKTVEVDGIKYMKIISWKII